MSEAQWLGAALMALPFVVIAVFATKAIGGAATAGIFALTAAMILVVSAGSFLLSGAW